jgi:hypothetical protein
MSTRIMKIIRGTLWLIVASAFFVALLALIAVSVEQVYSGVVKPVLTSNDLTKMFWVSALIATLIPFCFLSAYSCIAFIAGGQKLWKLISRHSRMPKD